MKLAVALAALKPSLACLFGALLAMKPDNYLVNWSHCSFFGAGFQLHLQQRLKKTVLVAWVAQLEQIDVSAAPLLLESWEHCLYYQ